MSAHLDKLAAAHEARLEEALTAAIDDALAAFDWLTVTAALDTTDEADTITDHEHDQLAIALGLDGERLDALADAVEHAFVSAGIASLFAAAAAFAASETRHILNVNGANVAAATNQAARNLIDRFVAESTEALKGAIGRALAPVGTSGSRAMHLRRLIGLSSNQGRALDVMRDALRTYLAAPPKRTMPATVFRGQRVPQRTIRNADVPGILAITRGHLSAPQRNLIAKAMHEGIDQAGAERLLDQHAKALRGVRVRAAAGEGVHGIIESAKLTGWQVAQRFGFLPADQRRFWQTAGDERVRHAHAQVPGMNPLGVPLNQPFATPLGERMTPPLEYGCQCRAVLKAKL